MDRIPRTNELIMVKIPIFWILDAQPFNSEWKNISGDTIVTSELIRQTKQTAKEAHRHWESVQRQDLNQDHLSFKEIYLTAVWIRPTSIHQLTTINQLLSFQLTKNIDRFIFQLIDAMFTNTHTQHTKEDIRYSWIFIE